ncbi:MAG: protein kinase, partial [Chthoniobacteraceae bacterium]
MGRTTQTYDILTRIAVGNGALVYRAVDKTTMRQVALKLLVQDGDLDHRFNVDALLADSNRLRQISGTQVCHLLDAYTDEDGPVLAYEFADGISGVEFPGQRKLTPTDALDVAAQLISALRSGERQKCPHGDLKPSNLVFVELPDKRPFLLVLDWGLAAHRSARPDDSLPFVAPERLAGGPASHAADLFSAGAVLFYLYTGRVLAGGATAEELLAAWRQARPATLTQLRPDLPAKLVQWVCSLLDLDPAKRPASAVEAGATLAAMGPPPPPVPPESIRPRPPAPASGISKPPPPPTSGIRAAPPTPASSIRTAPVASVSQARPVIRKAAPKAKASNFARNIALVSALLILICVASWAKFFRKRDSGVVVTGWEEKRTPAVEVRAAPQSVGPPIGRPYGPPPVAQPPPAQPVAKAKTAAKSGPAKPASKPKPAVTAPALPVIAADGFEYGPGGRIETVNGGSGWSGSWQGQPASIDGQSLVVPRFPARGGSLLIPPTEEEVTLSRQLGPLEKFVEPATGGVWYFACLLQHGSGLPVPGGDVQLNPFNGSNVHDLVRIVASDVGGALQLTLNNEKNPIEVKDASKPVLVVLRTTLANPKLGNWDLTAELFANPQLDAQGSP